MVKLLIGIGIGWLVLSIGVPMLRSVELPSSAITTTSIDAANAVRE